MHGAWRLDFRIASRLWLGSVNTLRGADGVFGMSAWLGWLNTGDDSGNVTYALVVPGVPCAPEGANGADFQMTVRHLISSEEQGFEIRREHFRRSWKRRACHRHLLGHQRCGRA